MRLTPFVLSIVLLVACGPETVGPRADDEDFVDMSGWEAFSVTGLKTESAKRDGSYFEALADPHFRMGLLLAPIGASIGLVTHLDNAVYYVQDGIGSLILESDTVSLAKGTMVFLRGGTEHQIRDVTEELDVVVVFPRGLGVPTDPELVVLDQDSLRAGRRPNEEVWMPLFEASTAGIGVYSLPKGGGGDEGLTNPFAEFKIVMSGGGRFDLGSSGIEASTGSIVYIPAGVRQQIRRVSDDMDLLVVWKK